MKKNRLFTISTIFLASQLLLAAPIKTFPAPNPAAIAPTAETTSPSKVEFKIKEDQIQKIAQNDTLKNPTDGTYIVKGRVVAANATEALNKEKFSASDVEEITNENFPQIIESFDYPNADIVEVAKAISELTGKNFIIDPNVRGKINIIAPTKITVAEAYKAFLSALAINAFAVVPSGSFLKIRPARNAQRDNVETYTGEYYPDFDQMITRIIHLKYISADEISKNLRILPSKDGEITPYPQTNSLILTDYGSNVNRVMKILEMLDRPGFEEKMEVIRIVNATAKEMAELIEQIITRGEGRANQNRGGFSSSLSRFNRSQSSSGSEVISIAVPDDRTNSIIVVGNDAGIDRIRKLVARLDFRLSGEESGGIHVYYVKNGEAEKIEETLNGLAQEANKQQQQQQQQQNRPGGATPPGAQPGVEKAQPIFGGDVKIVADKATNSLIISANKADYATVMSLLRKVDIPRDQVFVQAVIMEMNASDSNTYGISYFGFDKESKGVGRIGFNSGNIKSLFDIGSEGGILGFGSGEAFDISVGGQTVKVKSLMSFVNFLKTHTQANVLSTPQILALSNEKSTIEVGDEVPVSLNQSQNGTSTTANVQREKATVKLEVTPFISPESNLVRMKILQTARAVSTQPVQAAQLAAVSIALVDRSIDTNIVVNSGDTAVLGGLIKTDINETEKKVPILGDIPILGWLFRSTSKEKKKNNLMVFITPKILRSPEDAKNVLKAKLDERVDYIQEHFGGRDPFGKQIDSFLGNNAKSEENDIVDETLTIE